MSRDRSGPSIKFQLLIYPVTDVDDNSPSIREYGENHFLTRDLMEWFTLQYVATAADRNSPYVSPMKADVRGLPPALS